MEVPLQATSCETEDVVDARSSASHLIIVGPLNGNNGAAWLLAVCISDDIPHICGFELEQSYSGGVMYWILHVSLSLRREP